MCVWTGEGTAWKHPAYTLLTYNEIIIQQARGYFYFRISESQLVEGWRRLELSCKWSRWEFLPHCMVPLTCGSMEFTLVYFGIYTEVYYMSKNIYEKKSSWQEGVGAWHFFQTQYLYQRHHHRPHLRHRKGIPGSCSTTQVRLLYFLQRTKGELSRHYTPASPLSLNVKA